MGTQLMLTESRRLMLFSAMEAAMSMLTLTNAANFLSPCLMLLAAAATFNAAANFSPRHLSIARPLLSMNVVYHLYLVAGSLHVNEDPRARGFLLSISCVTILELMILKKVGFFHMALVSCSNEELERLRRLRQRNSGAVQRLQILIVVLILCFPLISRYLCLVGAGNFCIGTNNGYPHTAENGYDLSQFRDPQFA